MWPNKAAVELGLLWIFQSFQAFIPLQPIADERRPRRGPVRIGSGISATLDEAALGNG